MEAIPKSFMAVFLLTLFAFAMTGILGVEGRIYEARQTVAVAEAVIKEHDFSHKAIEKVKEDAGRLGYDMQISPYDLDSDGYDDMAMIRLCFEYSIGVLNIAGREHVIMGVAR